MEPQSPSELEAFTAVKRAERVRSLLQHARNITWLNTVGFLTQFAGVVIWLVVFESESSVMTLAIILLFSMWGAEQALGWRIKALVELFELPCGDRVGIDSAGSRPRLAP